jgi:hypothetical protein
MFTFKLTAHKKHPLESDRQRGFGTFDIDSLAFPSIHVYLADKQAFDKAHSPRASPVSAFKPMFSLPSSFFPSSSVAFLVFSCRLAVQTTLAGFLLSKHGPIGGISRWKMAAGALAALHREIDYRSAYYC